MKTKIGEFGLKKVQNSKNHFQTGSTKQLANFDFKTVWLFFCLLEPFLHTSTSFKC